MVHLVRTTKCSKGHGISTVIIHIVHMALNKFTGVLYALSDAFSPPHMAPKECTISVPVV